MVEVASICRIYSIVYLQFSQPKWVYRAKKLGAVFLNGTSQYAHGDLCVRDAIYVVALSSDLF